MKKILNIFTVLISVTLLSSCLKDNIVLDPSKSNNVIEFGNPADIASPAGAKYYLFSPALEIKQSIELIVPVSYSGAASAPENITVTTALAPTSVITEYNTQQGTNFILLPSNLYTIANLVALIPSGERKSQIVINLKTDQFDLTKEYVLPLTIASSSFGIISSNFRTILLNIKAKNKYDGIYTVSATAPMLDVVSAALTGFYPIEQDLITQGANTVAMYDGRFATANFAHPIKSGTATSSYGNFSPVFAMDADGKVTSVTNYFGQGTNSSLRSARLDPTGVNKFTVTGDTKILEVKYVLIQGGSDRTFFSEKWVFKSARP
ncbi:DUF1735 domain-containing protein [Pedobacter psychrophilus]|nr:DUF1735 domain-containing protein [Pedobacter psychrophilus]